MKSMKILVTNRINIIGVFMTVLIGSIINNYIIDDGVTRNLFQSICSAIILVCLYGLIFWICFLLALVVLDLILIVPNQKNLKLKLLLEWGLISSPLGYSAMLYERQRYIYIVAIITFLITQLLRKKLIEKLVVNRQQKVDW